VRALIASLQAEEYVEWMGYVDEATVRLAYSEAGVFCFPSYYEGFGIPLLEAQRSGVPCVALKNSCFEEVYGDSVFYAEEGGAFGLAKALGCVLESESLRRSLIQKGRLNAERYTWSAAAVDMAQILGIG